jgi:hypothetical protein
VWNKYNVLSIIRQLKAIQTALIFRPLIPYRAIKFDLYNP